MLGYAAVHFNRVSVDRGLVLKALALYSLVNTAVNLVTRKGFGEKVRQHPGWRSLAVVCAGRGDQGRATCLWLLLAGRGA